MYGDKGDEADTKKPSFVLALGGGKPSSDEDDGPPSSKPGGDIEAAKRSAVADLLDAIKADNADKAQAALEDFCDAHYEQREDDEG